LVEGVFPEEELPTQIVQIPQPQTHHWMPGILQGLDGTIIGAVFLQTQIDKHPIIAVHIGRPDWLAHHRQDTLSLFAGAFGDELLHPIAKAGDLR
jgi:hypothetical protein